MNFILSVLKMGVNKKLKTDNLAVSGFRMHIART